MSVIFWLRLGMAVTCWQCLKADDVCILKDFTLQGDYKLGGLFGLHGITANFDSTQKLPVELRCSQFPFLPTGYQQVHVLRFTVEEINNSSVLLPGVKLGYTLFDFCSNVLNFRSTLDFLSLNGSVPLETIFHEVVAVLGPFGSAKTLSVAPFFMANLVPMVNHVASSVQLSNKILYPSFFRTIPSDLYQVRSVVRILLKFQWNWVAFFGSTNSYSQDALTVFLNEINNVDICLAYHGILFLENSTYEEHFAMLTSLNINVVIVFANIEFVIPFIQAAAYYEVKKVWIASEAWVLSQELVQMHGIKSIGVVLGNSVQGQNDLHGLKEFIYRSMNRTANPPCLNISQVEESRACDWFCDKCVTVDPEIIVNEDPSFNFAIYSSIYAIAYALHEVLQCGPSSCNTSQQPEPEMIINAIRDVNFTLYNERVKFDENGDPPAHYSIVHWDWRQPDIFVTIGSYMYDTEEHFFLNEQLINWQGNGTAPILRCSRDCDPGYRRVQRSFYSCCFDCEICINGTFMNQTGDPYTCTLCQADEWSRNGSTSCQKCNLDYLHNVDLLSIGLMFSACFILVTSLAIFILFAYNRNTPVVRSAGGVMCFFLLTCLGLSSISVFFFIGQPTYSHCILRNSLFAVFYTACLSCLAVRSFQIVCVFKMATNLPRAYEFWVKHNGQWLIILLSVLIQLFFCGLWIGVEGPRPTQVKLQSDIILDCSLGNSAIFYLIIIFLGTLSVACFGFAYMGTDLPKNYNEGKSITFCLLIFYISWAIFLTVRLAASDSNTSAVNAISILCSLYGVLYGYFLPKCYIIIIKPERNTAAYFQTSIQSYTLQNSSM